MDRKGTGLLRALAMTGDGGRGTARRGRRALQQDGDMGGRVKVASSDLHWGVARTCAVFNRMSSPLMVS